MNATIEDIFQKPDYSKLFKAEFLDTIIARPPEIDDKTKNIERPEEYLKQHSETTLKVFDTFVHELELELVFNNLLTKAFGKSDVRYWNMLRSIVYFHDFGKMNDAYQKRMQDITHAYSERKTPNLHKDSESNHSLPGLFLFGALLETYLKDEDDKTKGSAFFLASTIARHHTHLDSPVDIGQKIDDLWDNKKEFRTLLWKVSEEAKKTGKSSHLSLWFNPSIQSPSSRSGAIFRFMQENLPVETERREAIFYLHKLLYSCLVSADYYAAFHGEAPSKISNTLPDISGLKTKLNTFLSEKQSDEPISKAREKFRKFSHQKLDENSEKNVFYLYLPTGAGKTLTSLSLALELAGKNISKRLFYVFPFVNIIEQNQQELKKALGNEELVSPIYSYSEWNLKENETDEVHFINQEFTNYPVVVMSNVNFFNALIKSGKSSNYKLHNFANSVIVLDEIQSLNAKEWTLYNDLITNTAKMLNSKIIVMSASIPPIHKLALEEDMIEKEIGILIEPDTAELNADFVEFWNRVDLILETKDSGEVIGKGLIKLTKEKIAAHKKPVKVLVVANTIKKSLEAYLKLSKDETLNKEYEIILLNGTMLPSRRREIIKKFESDKPERRLILVSTQSVEAGLNLDFDMGVRELAPLDNLLQVCGRVNRNMKKKAKSPVYIATENTAKDSVVYGELRFRGKPSEKDKKNQKENMQKRIEDLIKHKENDMDNKYKGYSEFLVKEIKKQNEDVYRESQMNSVESLRELDFESLNEHEVIEQRSVSIFVPLDIDISNERGIINLAINEFGLKLIGAEGEKRLPAKTVLELYLGLCKSKDRKKNVALKKLAPLLNQFIISISYNRAHKLGLYVEDMFPGNGKDKYSTFLSFRETEMKEVYSLEEGLRVDKLASDSDDAVIW